MHRLCKVVSVSVGRKLVENRQQQKLYRQDQGWWKVERTQEGKQWMPVE